MGGAEISLCLLLEHIDRRTVEPILVCPEGPLAERGRRLGVEVAALILEQVGYAHSWAQATSFAARVLRSARRLARQVRIERADIIHANTVRAALIAGAAKLVFRSPGMLIVHVRDIPPPSLQTRLAFSLALCRADAAIAISGAVRDNQVRIAGFAEKVRVVYNGVDTEAFNPAKIDAAPLRQELGLAQCYPVVTTIGQITPWKGQLELVKAFACVAREYPEARLMVVGETKFTGSESRFDVAKYEDRLRGEAQASGTADKVLFTGERNDIAAVLKASDIVVQASWEEPFGLAAVEAMCMSKPVVGTRAGGTPEIITDGESGILVPPRDPDSIAQAILRLASDRELSRRLGENAARVARERFGAAREAEELTRVYLDIMPTGRRQNEDR